jgi:2-polyprenyl-3-methyl-5-hydroxy-6-metoxy-1,4-benzoquinol methylase
LALYISDRLKFLNKKQAKKTLKQFYDYAYQDGYTSSNSLGTWGMIIKQGIKFKKALDVGCGVGAGVKMCREKDLNVYGCDLANAVEQWNKREIESYCTVAKRCPMTMKSLT